MLRGEPNVLLILAEALTSDPEILGDLTSLFAASAKYFSFLAPTLCSIEYAFCVIPAATA